MPKLGLMTSFVEVRRCGYIDVERHKIRAIFYLFYGLFYTLNS